MASGDTKTNQYLDIAANGTRADLPTDTCCETRTQTLIRGVAERVMDVEDEVERLENNPDVVDIVATYADLQAYDTSTLTDKDVIRVLTDSTHNNNSTFYRWNAATNQFDYIGEVTSGPTVVQTTGTSTTDVMSQNAVTSMVFSNPQYADRIKIGPNAVSSAESTIALQRNATAQADYAIAIGRNSKANYAHSIALGSYSKTSAKGEMNIGTFDGLPNTFGYNNSMYRLLTGLYDPQNAHDAATKGYVDTLVGDIEAALNAINNGGNS